MKTKQTLIIFMFSVIFFYACKNDNEPTLVSKDLIDGVIQKGPFVNGSSISLFELSEILAPSGKTYNTQIVDDKGTFEIKNILLESSFVKLKADGYYFNEVNGQKSTSQLTLYAVSDLSDKSSVNVNILTHLENQRVETLVAQGNNFKTAKEQAEAEVLKIFSLSKNDIKASESLNITNSGDDNAILLAISIIAQGFRSEADLTDLLARIVSDIKEDGELNNQELGTMLINDAKLLNLPAIRANMVRQYSTTDNNAVIPDFEKFIQLFIDNTEFVFTKKIEYPEFSAYGENILFGDKSQFKSMETNSYSLSAVVPVGASLKIVMKGQGWYYNVSPNGPVNWKVSSFDHNKKEQTFTFVNSGEPTDIFTTINAGKQSDLIIKLMPGNHAIEYYENNAATPTFIKEITVTD
jgi:hypothetical protein